MRRRRWSHWGAAALLATCAGVCFSPTARAGEETPQQVIERLAPTLRSNDRDIRTRAERELFALGDAGRAELERLANGDDPSLASLAMRYLQRQEWDARGDADEPGSRRTRDVEREIERLGEDLARQMERLRKSLRRHLEESLEGTEWVEPKGTVTTQSGTIVENGRIFTWKKAADGKLEVTVQDGKDAEKRTFHFDSIEQARKAHPDVAKRLEEALRSTPTPDLRLRFPPSWREGFEELELPDEDDFARLRRQLRDWVDPETDTRPSGPKLGILYTEPTPALRAHLGLEKGGMVITRVTPGSTAARLGLAPHDVLVLLAGKVVTTPKQIRTALESVKAGATLTAVVYRRGARTRLQTTR